MLSLEYHARIKHYYRVFEWNTPEKKLNLITCLELLFGADPGILIRAKRKRIFDFLFESFLKLLQKDNLNEVIRNALDLLPVFITLDGPYLEKVSRMNIRYKRSFILK